MTVYMLLTLEIWRFYLCQLLFERHDGGLSRKLLHEPANKVVPRSWTFYEFGRQKFFTARSGASSVRDKAESIRVTKRRP